MDKPKIDYKKIDSDITDKCNSLLKVIDENSISDTFDAVKEMVEIAVNSYSYKISDSWKEENSDSDTQRKIKFTDVESGYLKLIKKWIRQNPLNTKLPEYPQNPSDLYGEYSSKINKVAVVFGVTGTAVVGASYAKGWWILGNPIVAIAAELITLAILYKIAQCKNNAKRKEIESDMAQIREKQNNYKQQLIDCLICAASKWIEAVEKYSDSILKTF